jgi:hypothetical protein
MSDKVQTILHPSCGDTCECGDVDEKPFSVQFYELRVASQKNLSISHFTIQILSQ